jgi:sec-independent protein translocase protein TatA
MNFGPTELIIILVIVLVLFGVGRIGKIGGEIGTAVANFRKGVKASETDNASTDNRAEVSS